MIVSTITRSSVATRALDDHDASSAGGAAVEPQGVSVQVGPPTLYQPDP
jgi:hypothetical protein